VTFKPPKTHWNGDQLGYDELILNPNDSRECTYCLTQPQAKALLALIDRYRFTTRWYSPDEPVDVLDIEHFVNDCQRRLMMACCGDEIPFQYRYTTDGDLEFSDDGGLTWKPAENRDPRVYSTTFPPPAGDMANKCSAADSGVTAIIVDVFNEFSESMTNDDLQELMSTWVKKYIETANPLLALIAVVVNLIFILGMAALIAAVTTDVWNKLRCCFLEHMSDDLDFDHDAWLGVRECITADITGIAGVFLEHLIYLIGEKGLTNICRSGKGSPTADCDYCTECACDYADWILNGTFVSCETDSVIVEAHLDGGVYSVYMGYGGGNTYDADSCRDVTSWNAVDGSISDPAGYNSCHTGENHSGFLGTCAAQHYWTSNAAFSVRIVYGSGCDDCG